MLGRDPIHDEMARLYAKYLWHLAEDIWTAQGYRVLEGAEQLRAAHPEQVLGSLTEPFPGLATTPSSSNDS